MNVWDNEDIGKRIKRIREERSLTQERLGRLTGLSESTINRIETGATRFLGDFRERIAGALDISEDYLQNGDSHAERETRKLIDELRSEFQITQSEEERLQGMATEAIKFRNNARIPLSKLELQSLLMVIRGR